MKLIVATLILLAGSHASNTTEDVPSNKTKRTVAGQVQNYGEQRPVVLYENPPQPLPSLYAPVTLKPIFDPELPKQVAAQQVLYEFQQTPTNAVSNVHVNQFYQPVANKPEAPPITNASPAPYGSESVATPVQHSSLVRHGQNFAQVQYHPQHVQTHHYIPGKYLYVNGKIVYQPGQQANGFQVKPVGYTQYMHPQAPTQKFLPPPLVVRPMRYRHFSPPDPNQFQPITKPMKVPQVNEEQSEEPEKKEEEVEEEEEEEEEDKASYEEGDDDDGYFSKYSFDDDDHEGYRDEEEEDNERGSSKQVQKKKKVTKPKSKYNKSDFKTYREDYSSSSKYESPKKAKKNVKKQKMVKYTREGGKHRGDRLEGKQSQNVPVVHKQKIFKEKWFLTKSTDDSAL